MTSTLDIKELIPVTRGASRLIAVAAVLALGTTVSAGASTDPAPADESTTPLTRVLRAERQDHRVPGMQATYVDRSTITTAVAGVRKLGTGDPVRPGHFFHLASQTKAVTATAIASLVEQHRLRWS